MKLRFSDRIGVTKPSDVLQIGKVSQSLRNLLWNVIYQTIYSQSASLFVDANKELCSKFFKETLDSLPGTNPANIEWLRNKFFSEKFSWYDVYNLLEFIGGNCQKLHVGISSDSFKNMINEVLEEENSGYRFIGDELAPITNKEEMESIKQSILEAEEKNLFGTTKHLRTAVTLLSKKPDPDYRNSIKESISAVEALVKQIAEEKGGGLDKALAILDSKVKFHPKFKSGLSSLYHYTSDANGIRHAILEEQNIGFDEAKFMLVSCSALVNFLIAKAEKSGMLKDE